MAKGLKTASRLSAIALLAASLQGCVLGSSSDDFFSPAGASSFASASYARRSSNIASGNAREARTLVESLPVCTEARADIATAREIAVSVDALAQQADEAADMAAAANDARGGVETMRGILERDLAPTLQDFDRLRAELETLPHEYWTGLNVSEGSSRGIGDIVADYDRIAEQLAVLGGRLTGMSDRIGDFLRGPESAAMRDSMPSVDYVAMERDIATRVEDFAVRANELTSFLVFEGDGSVPYAALDYRKRQAVNSFYGEIDAVITMGRSLGSYLLTGRQPGSVAVFLDEAGSSATEAAARESARAADLADRSQETTQSLRQLAQSIRETCGRRDVFADVLSPPDWMSTDWVISSP